MIQKNPSNELAQLKSYLDDLKKNYPRTRQYPDEFWQKCLPLARQYGEKFVAEKLGINQQNINRRLIGERGPRSSNIHLVEATPIKNESKVKEISLELPWGIKLRAEL